MEIKTASAEELIERRSAIATELDAPEADLDALEAEVRAINEVPYGRTLSGLRVS